jgi:hypothetical protein
MNKNTPPQKKTHFGQVSLVLAVISLIFLGAFLLITLLNITPETFFKFNTIFVGAYCIATLLAFMVGGLGLVKRNDSKRWSLLALSLTGIPFLIFFWQFISSFVR